MKRSVKFVYTGVDGEEDMVIELSGDKKHVIFESGNFQQHFDGECDTYSFDIDEITQMIDDLTSLRAEIIAATKEV